MQLITDQKILEDICNQLSKEEIISVDTEFHRRVTYFAKLSIIQIVTKNHQIIIDYLAGLDLTPLKSIFLNTKILKIFHSAREDFEIFYRLFGVLPCNIFDTQIAASCCGLGNSVSYSDLCQQICDVTIDKKYQKANWLKRPIKPQMLEYAIKDVQYLEPLYSYLLKKIEENHTQEEYKKKLETLLLSENFIANLEKAWLKVKFQRRSKAFNHRMQIIAAFREECARKGDIPKRHFASDEDLVKICEHLPITNAELDKLKLNSCHFKKDKYKNKLFDLCAALGEDI